MLAFPKPEARPKKARKPLRRTWMRKRRPRRLSRAGSDPAYLAAVRELPCFVASDCCWGPIHAHHAIHRSQGGNDNDAVPLCLRHHACWHGATSPFERMSRLERFAWAVNAIAKTQARVAARRVQIQGERNGR